MKVKHGEMKQQHPLKEDQVEEAEEGHVDAWNHYKKGAITIPGINAEVSTVRWGNLDKDVVVSFPDFGGQHGPVTLQVTESEPYDFFSLLFPEELWDVLVEQTNIYVAQKQRKSWFNDTNKDEMKAFVGALFFMAIHRLPNFDHYFSRDWVFAVPAIQNVFTRNRFWQLW